MFDHSKVKRNAAILLAKIQITFKFYCDIQILNILSLPRKNNKTVKLPLKQKTNLMVPCSTIKKLAKSKTNLVKNKTIDSHGDSNTCFPFTQGSSRKTS